MAGSSGGNRDRRNNRGRKVAPVIEMMAVELPQEPERAAEAAVHGAPPEQPVQVPPAAVADAAAGSPEAEPAVEPVRPAEPRPEPHRPDIITAPPEPAEKPGYVLPLAVAGLVGAILGAVAGTVVPGFFAGPAPVDAGRVQRLEQGLATLQQRPVPSSAPSNAAELQALGQKLGAIEAELGRRADALDRKIAAIPPPQPAAPVPAGPAVDLRPLAERIGALDRAVLALDHKAEAARVVAVEGIRLIEPQLRELTARVNLAAQRAETITAAPLYSAAEALRQALQRGAAFSAEITALEALGVKPDQLAGLKAAAAQGVPTAQQLAAAFQPLAMAVAKAGQQPSGGLQALFDSVVRTRATGSGAADTPDGLVSAIENALKSGDVAGALAAWGKLPEASRKASEAWAASAQQREAAWKAAADIRESALATLRKAAP